MSVFDILFSGLEWRPSSSPRTSATHSSADSTYPKVANAAGWRCSSCGAGCWCRLCCSSTGRHDASAAWHSVSGGSPARHTVPGRHSWQAPSASSSRRHDDRTDATTEDASAATAKSEQHKGCPPKHAHNQNGSRRPAPPTKCLGVHGSRWHRCKQAADDEPAATAGRHDAQSSAFSAAAGYYTAATAAGETLLHAAVVNNCQDYPIFLPGKLSETKLVDLRLKFNFKHGTLQVYPQCRASIGKQSSSIVVSTESHFGSNLASAEGNLLQQWAKN